MPEQFFDIFVQYNRAVFPAQIALILIAVAALTAVIAGGRKISFLLIAGLWAWCGVVYHLIFFTRINGAAYVFGAMFLLQAALFAFAAFRPAAEEPPPMLARRVGITIVIFALVVYPMPGAILGRTYPASVTFGLPCPLTVYTFGTLLLVHGKLPRHLLIIPTTWALIGSTAAIFFGVYEDLSLTATAVIALSLWWRCRITA